MLNVQLTVPNARVVRRLAVKHGLVCDPMIDDFLQSIPRATKLDGFNFVLKDYQADAVAWLEAQGGRGLLADEQGLGKTAEVMAYAHKAKAFPMLILAPNTLKLNWRNEIIAWHESHVTNGPTEAVNNLVKRVKRTAFGFRSFRAFRIRSLLYAGRPNWAPLQVITPR